MALLSNEDREVIRNEWFKDLKNEIEILFFEKDECQTCDTIKEILGELSELEPKISYEVLKSDDTKAKEYGVDKAPALVMKEKGGEDKGVKFYGLPAGHEFVSLLSSIKMIGEGKADLQDSTIEKLKGLGDKQIHIQVFITLSCPYCPNAVIMAHKMAYAMPNIKADMINAEEFFELSNKFGVSAVPRVVINDNHYFEGALPEDNYVEEILKA